MFLFSSLRPPLYSLSLFPFLFPRILPFVGVFLCTIIPGVLSVSTSISFSFSCFVFFFASRFGFASVSVPVFISVSRFCVRCFAFDSDLFMFFEFVLVFAFFSTFVFFFRIFLAHLIPFAVRCPPCKQTNRTRLAPCRSSSSSCSSPACCSSTSPPRLETPGRTCPRFSSCRRSRFSRFSSAL